MCPDAIKFRLKMVSVQATFRQTYESHSGKLIFLSDIIVLFYSHWFGSPRGTGNKFSVLCQVLGEGKWSE